MPENASVSHLEEGQSLCSLAVCSYFGPSFLNFSEFRIPTVMSGMQKVQPCWHTVVVSKAFAVSGGASTKQQILDVMEFQTASGARNFCKVNKNDAWLLHCTVGPGAVRGAATRSKILEDLKVKLIAASGEDHVCEPAVAEEVDHDPMNALEELAPEPSPKKTRYSLKRWRDRIIDLQMPKTPLVSDNAAVAAETCTVSVLARSTNQLWIDIGNLEWLINYMGKEVALGGVPEDEPAVAESNCEVDFLRIQWNFGDQSWRAEFVSGPLEGQSFTSRVSSLTSEKWASVGDLLLGDFEGASFEDCKECTRLYLQAFCAMKLQNAAVA